MLTLRSRSGLARFRAMRWPALVMLLLILVQSIGVAACVDHDLRAYSGSTTIVVDALDNDNLGAGQQVLHTSACSHCVCPHFVALPAVHVPTLADPSAQEQFASRSWLPASAPLDEALRPPAAV
ncbi:MAG: hypothetical protein U1F26_09490 [Lysobacterales bacterium]